MCAILLEREAEITRGNAALRDGGAGRGGLLLVEGAPGVGKTRLLTRFAATAREDGMAVLRARAAEGERAFAFGVVRQLLTQHLLGLGAARRRRILSGPAALALPILDPTAASAEPGEATLQGLFWVVCALAAIQPLLVAVDDLHWADDASRAFLAFLGRRIDGLAVTLALAARPREPGAPPGVLDVLAGEPTAHVLRPAPLSPASVATIVQSRLGEPDATFARACATASAGNPFLLGELVTELERRRVAPAAANAQDVARLRPDGVIRALGARVARLDGPGAAVAEAVAVLGDGADADEVAELAGLAPAEVDGHAHELAELGVLEPGTLGFAHPLVRAAIGERIAGRRERLHSRAAEVVRRRPNGRERAAAHLLHVAPSGDPDAFATLRSSGEEAIDRGAAATAVLLLQRALDEPAPPGEHGATAYALALALARDDRRDDALAALEDIGDAPPDVAADARILGAQLRMRAGEVDLALDALGAAGSRAGADAAAATRLGIERIATLASAVQPIDEAELGALVERAAGLDERTQRLALSVRAVAHTVAGRRADAVADAQRAAAIPPASDEHASAGVWPGALLVLNDELAAAERVLGDDVAAAQRRGATFHCAVALGWRGIGRQRSGRLAEAEEDCLAALDGGLNVWLGGPGVCGALVAIALERGDLDAARSASARADAMLGDARLPDDFLLAARAELALAEDRPDVALGLAERSRQRLRDQPIGPAGHTWEPTAVAVLARLGRTAQARELAAGDVASARAFGGGWRAGIALTAAASVHGDDDEAAAMLDEAIDGLRRVDARVELARAELARARLLPGDGDTRERLRDALELAERCGAVVLASQLREQLVATGARPRRAQHVGPESLTPAERRSARLAAAGEPNAAIAAALFITPKTVEKHLTACYRKLGVRSRAQLAAALDG